MRFTEVHVCVCFVEDCCAESAEVDCVADRRGLEGLTAAVHAAAGARHDFDEIDFFFTVLDFGEEFIGVLGAACDGNLDFHIAELVGRALDGSGAADVVEIELFEGLAEDDFRRGSESGFHNAAGSAEDCASAGADVEGLVEFLIREGFEGDPAFRMRRASSRVVIAYVYVRDARGVLMVATDLEFLAVQGMQETKTMSFGSSPAFSA